MANILDDVMPKILSAALQSLRETCVMPRLVNGDYSQNAAEKGDTVNVPIPTAIAARDVIPGNVAPDPDDLTLNTAPIPLNNWKEAPFYLTDKDQRDIMDGVVPMQVEEAGKSIANAIDASLLNLYKYSLLFTGQAGTTPFGATEGTLAAQNARKLLNLSACPPRDRRMVLDVEADANASGLPQFQSVDRSGSSLTIVEGMIGRKLGFDFYYDQLMPSHTPTRPNGAPTGFLVNQATHAVGSKEVTLDTGTGDIAEGDLFTVAGDSQTYVVRAVNGTTIQYLPAAKAVDLAGTTTAFVDNAAITFVPDHAVNLAFHRDSIGLAVRSLQESELELALGGRSMVMIDPVSQIPLRLEVVREHKRVRWSIDCLWGVGAVRPDCMARVIG